MNRSRLIVQSLVAAGLLAFLSNATAAPISYFDAQILDFNTGKTIVPKNTVMCSPGQGCAETAFTDLPYDGTTNPTGNWTQNGATFIPPGTGTGSDNAWNQRFATPAPGNFGNPDASGNGTVYESRGAFGGPNTEDPAVLKTTVNVPLVDQGTTRGVYALFWTDQSNWQIAACLECAEDERMQLFSGNTHTPAGYVFGVYDVGAGDPGNLSALDLEMNGYTTSDAMPTGSGGTNRRLKAAWLGNVTLGSQLSVFVGNGPAFANTGTDSQNNRTWYDGIAYGDTQNLQPLICIPEPACLALVGLALGIFGFVRRRS